MILYHDDVILSSVVVESFGFLFCFLWTLEQTTQRRIYWAMIFQSEKMDKLIYSQASPFAFWNSTRISSNCCRSPVRRRIDLLIASYPEDRQSSVHSQLPQEHWIWCCLTWHIQEPEQELLLQYKKSKKNFQIWIRNEWSLTLQNVLVIAYIVVWMWFYWKNLHGE
jgi:hypothetical protein